MSYNKTRDLILESISSGVTDFHKIDRYKRIDLSSAYIGERDNENLDPVLNLNKLNSFLLRDFLTVHTEQKLSQLKEELSDAIINENYDELEDIFENELSNFYSELHGGIGYVD